MQYSFGDYLLDPERRELTLGPTAISVGPQVFDLLLCLVRNREHVVSKDELLDVVWNGRIVSESTLTSHINAARKAIGDSGQDQRLIRTISRKGFRFVGDVMERKAAISPGAARDAAADRTADGTTDGTADGVVNSGGLPANASTLPDKPSLAVLPFLNLSGDSEQDYFIDGVVEDIISALSRVRWLFVIARNSSFTYKGRAVDVKQVGRELGVRYLLEGSMRKSASRVRITGQLIDATTGAHIWAERFDGTLGDIFELQDQVTANVVGTIAPQLERAEIERAQRKPTDSLGAYDYFLRGMANVHRGTRTAIDEGLSQFSKAIELDPAFAAAYAMAAWCHFWRKINGWMSNRTEEIAEGTRLARRAIELGKDDPVALARSGHALGHLTGDLDSGIALVDRALVLNPNYAAAWFLGGFLRIWRGEFDDAIERFARAMQLSPLDSETYRMQAGTAMANLLAGHLDAAVAWAEKAHRELPSFLIAAATIAASHALADRTNDAQRALRHLRALDPDLRLSSLEDWLPFRRAEDLATFAEGLRRAGLPE